MVTASFLLLTPIWLAGDGPDRLTKVYAMAASSSEPFFENPARQYVAIADGAAYHAVNLETFTAVALFEPLSFSVLNTVRRLCVVCSGFLYQGNTCSAANMCGIVLVFVGSGIYNVAAEEMRKTQDEKVSVDTE